MLRNNGVGDGGELFHAEGVEGVLLNDRGRLGHDSRVFFEQLGPMSGVIQG